MTSIRERVAKFIFPGLDHDSKSLAPVTVRIDDSGHFVMLDQPNQLADMIEHFAAQPEGESIAAR